MALSSELLKKFNQEDISLSNRLSAGKNLFCISEVNYLKRKEDFVLDWLCKLLGRHDTIEVWKTVRDCLSSRQMQKINARDITVPTKEALCKVLSKSSHIDDSVLRECALLCIESAVFQQYLRMHKQSFISLFQMLLKSVGNSGDLNAFIRCSQDLRSFTKYNFGDEKIFPLFVENFLVPFVEAFTLLKKKEEEDFFSHKPRNEVALKGNETIIEAIQQKGASSVLQSELIQLIQDVLFPKSFYPIFHQFLSSSIHEANSSIKSKNHKIDLLCLCLSSVVPTFPEKVVINLHTVIFQAFVQSYPTYSVYPFFIILCFFLGFSPSVQVNSSKVTLTLANKATLFNKKSKVSFSVLKKLVDYLMEVDLVFDQAIRGVTFLQWLEGLVLNVVSGELSSQTYQIIYSLGQLNPLIVAPVMSDLLAKLLFQVKPTEEERESYKCFIQGTFDNFVKLNQIPELVGDYILPALKQALHEKDFSSGRQLTISDVLPEGSLSVFTRHLMALPNTVCVSLLKMFVQHLAEDIVEAMEDEKSAAGCWLVLEVVASLLKAFFAGVRLAEQTVPMPTRTAFVTELLKLRAALGSIGKSLLKRDHNSEALSAFLQMSHTCGEMQLLLLWYSPLSEHSLQLQPDDDDDDDDDLKGEDVYNLHCLHSFLSSKQWMAIGERVESSNNEACQKTMDFLLLQKLNLLAVFSGTLKHSVRMRAALCKHVLDHIDRWWPVFLQKQSRTLTSLLTPEQFFEVAGTVVEKLLSSKKGKFEELDNPSVQENEPFVVALAWVTIQRLSKLFQKKRRRDADVSAHDQLVEEVVKQIDPVTALLNDAEAADVLKTALPKMADFINAACSSEEGAEVSSAFVLDLKNLELHFRLLRTLPLLFLPKLIRTVLTMPTLAVVISLNKRMSEEDREQVEQVQDVCLQILLALTEFTPLPVWASQLHPGELVKQLYFTGRCSPTVLQPIFMTCIRSPKRLEKLVAGTCQVDRRLGVNSVPLSLQLLQYVGKFPKLTQQEAYKACTKQLTKSLQTWLLRHLNSENETISTCTSPILDAYSLLLLFATKPKKAAKLLPHLDTIVAAALSIVKEEGEAVDHALLFLEAAAKYTVKLGGQKEEEKPKAKGLIVVIFHAVCTVPHRVKLAPRVAHLLSLASEEEFLEVMQSLKSNEDLKYTLVLLQHLAKLRLSPALSKLRNQAVAHVFEDLYKAFVGGRLKPIVFEALALENTVAVNMMKTLSRMCDVFLLTVMAALDMRSEPVEQFGPICLSAMQLLSGLARSSFPVIEERIPTFIRIVCLALHAVIAHSGTEKHLTGSNLENMISCAHYIERLCSHLVAQKRAFRAVAQFIVADVLLEFTEAAVHHAVKKPLMKSLYSLFELCDGQVNKHLLHALPYASLELYKKYNREYRKFYRYKGKV